ncbi:MAG TPA: hypothetical protein P5287_03835 [bacterium]|nr:hypothetical protein [bacterium]
MKNHESGPDRRTAKQRRESANRRRTAAKSLLRALTLTERRKRDERRAGLDRREELAKGYQKEQIIRIHDRSLIKRDPEKAKMTYIWEKGLRAISFRDFKIGDKVDVAITLPGYRRKLRLSGSVMRTRKVFTDHGFATEVDVKFQSIGDKEKLEINNLLWSDGDL